MSAFKKDVYRIVSQIPEGKVMTYKEVACAIGKPQASRAVGAVLRANYDASVPCHRVIRSDGKLGGYNRGGKDKKEEILKREGAILTI